MFFVFCFVLLFTISRVSHGLAWHGMVNKGNGRRKLLEHLYNVVYVWIFKGTGPHWAAFVASSHHIIIIIPFIILFDYSMRKCLTYILLSINLVAFGLES